jgi:hypothetical protein
MCLIEAPCGVLPQRRGAGRLALEVSAGLWVGFLTRCLPVGVLDCGVARKRREHIDPNQAFPLRSPVAERRDRVIDVMIGIDPHKGSIEQW